MGYILATVVVATCLVWSPGVHSLILKNKPIKLNVGGHYFTTSLETLSKSKKLKSMFEDENNFPPQDEDGRYFIDHDGEMFKYVLRYLRTGNLTFPEDFIDGKVLEETAAFYQIDRLKVALEFGVSQPDVILYLVMNGFDSPDSDLSLQSGQGSVTWEEIFQKFESELNSKIDYMSNSSSGVHWERAHYDVRGVPFNVAMKKVGSQDFFFTSEDLNLKFKILKILFEEGYSIINGTDNNSAAKERALHLGFDSILETYFLKRVRQLID